MRDTTTGTVVTCRSSAANGTLRSGSGLPGYHAGSLSAVSFSSCSSPGAPRLARQPAGLPRRLVFTLQAGGLPWHVNFSSYNAAKGAARGRIGHLHLTFSGAGCTAVIDGTSATADDGQVAFRYTDSTSQLKVLTTFGNLHFCNVSAGCLGLINSGDTVTLTVICTVTPTQVITSP